MTQDIDQDEIKGALATILADDKFAAAPQMSAFLNYVVHQSLAGEADRIKAYTVAVDALGKPPTFDPQNDPSVRVLAKRLRSSLDQYYDRTAGHDVIIELRSGSYRPLFRRAENPTTTVSDATAVADSGTTPSAGESASDATVLETDMQAVTDIDGRDAPAPVAASAPVSESSADTQRPEAPRGPTVKSQASGDSSSGKTGDWYRGLGRVPRPVLAVLAIAALGFALLEQREQQSLRATLAEAGTATATIGSTPTHIALANSVDPGAARARPDMPTVFIPRLLPRDGLLARVSNSIGGVISHFEMLEVVRSRPASSIGQWPEDYELAFHSVNVENEAVVELQLLHAPTGRVAHVERLRFDDADADLSRAEMQRIERIGVALAEPDGPLLRDYRRLADLAPAFECLFTTSQATTTDTAPTASEPAGCARVTDGTLVPTIARAQALTRDARALPANEREAPLEQARRLAASALEQAPYRARVHAVLMQLDSLDGDWQAAIDHGRRAIELNPYDDDTLLALADAMVRSGRPREADEYRRRARALQVTAERG